MALQNNFKNFDAIKVPLKGSNLIEASAGTGKTYSIAILVLRLILENKISLRQILMVTFTKAAVAELETRIRSFVKKAYRASQGLPINEEIISELVTTAIGKIGKDQVNLLLKDAVTTMDETSVMTIHSFCQQTLNEFAFETNQLFSAEMVGDTSGILQDELNKFWRKNITTIATELLSILINKGLSQNEIYCIVKEHLDGKLFYKYNSDVTDPLDEKQQITIVQSITEIEKKKKGLEPSFVTLIKNNKNNLLQRTLANRFAKKTIIPDLLNDPIRFMEYLLKLKPVPNYIGELYEESGALAVINDLKQLDKEIEELIQKYLDHLYSLAINEISAGVHKFQLSNNQLSYADLISNLNTALTKNENPRLVRALKEKYKAVFIDEFQDTDRLQYEIFNTAFGKSTILFYIGDPKQSIYSFRTADIFTYLKAKEDVENRYEMNTNFRSTESYISAMNEFFLPKEDFDTFHFGELQNAIKYNPVKSPDPNTKGVLLWNEKEVIPISINDESNSKPDIANSLAKHVANLLSGSYSILKGELSERITPSDIGILVRSNKYVTDIKKALAKYNIPSVSINKFKVLQSPEANELLYVLIAMEEPIKNNINKALLTCFTQYSIKEILSLNHEIVTTLFREYKSTWEKEGVYTAIIKFISDFEIRKKLLNNPTENGERILTNLHHLIELLYKNQRHKNWRPIELIEWLQHGIEQKNAEGDELEQRIETDEEAVTITTIHSSKGLQYKIVLAPDLDLVENKRHKMGSFRDPETGNYLNAKKGQLTVEDYSLFQEQSEQENRRLLYVTLTRSVYKSFIFKNNSKNSTLAQFTNNLKDADPDLIEWIKTPEISEGFKYNFKKEKEEQRIIQEVNFSIQQQKWRRMSYSGLNIETDRILKPKFEPGKNDYDNFIFKDLAKGKITGNMLHFIFEKLAFKNLEKWEITIQNAIKRFAPTKEKNYAEWLPKLLIHVMKANIETTHGKFQLSEIDTENQIHELEFDFPMGMFNPSILTDFSFLQQNISTRFYEEMEGIMNGKIDLLFELNEQYFILDWKSNYLGGELDNYDKPSLEAAMDENNYHLQYYIYTVAAKKYLELRLPDFNYEKDFGGVLYCFVRGMREEKNTGIFWTKPSLDQISKLENLLNTHSKVE